MFFNFHNVVLASQPEVRQAIAMAIDHQALIQTRHGFATPLCTDHGSFYHPGYEVNAPCLPFEPAAANKLLSDNGWVKGPDGVRSRDGQRLEFEYSTSDADLQFISDSETIIQRNLQAIGIQLDIQNYSTDQLFNHLLPEGKASPPSGAVAGRYDIAEYAQGNNYDPDDSWMLSCDQIPPKGSNFDFYCNPALDALYQQERATVDLGVRQQLFAQIHEIYLTDFPFITLYSETDPSIVRKGTHNYQSSPLTFDFVNMWQWWCDKGKC
jgi:peptide/nickel transport system substrate-binding protein